MGLNGRIFLFSLTVTNVTAMEVTPESSFPQETIQNTSMSYPPAPPLNFSSLSFPEEKNDTRLPMAKIDSIESMDILNNFPSAPPWYPQEESQTGLRMPYQTEFQTGYNSNYQALAPYYLQEQMQLSLSSSPQYVMIPQEDLLKLMQSVNESKNEQKEMKQMMQLLLSQGDKQVEVLEQIEQGQMTLTGEIETLKGKISKVTQQLTNPNQSTFEKTCNWGGLLFKAGLSGATALTTYGALVPALSLLPSFIAPPLAVPILFASYSGLHLFAKLV